MTELDEGITVNVGVISGGTRTNVIAAEAVGEVDVRVLTNQQASELREKVLNLRPTVPGTTVEVQEQGAVPPLEATPRNRALWKAARQAGAELGMALQEETAGGGSDGNTTSQYTATLDGLGAVGDGAHASHEFLYIDKQVDLLAPAVHIDVDHGIRSECRKDAPAPARRSDGLRVSQRIGGRVGSAEHLDVELVTAVVAYQAYQRLGIVGEAAGSKAGRLVAAQRHDALHASGGVAIQHLTNVVAIVGAHGQVGCGIESCGNQLADSLLRTVLSRAAGAIGDGEIFGLQLRQFSGDIIDQA